MSSAVRPSRNLAAPPPPIVHASDAVPTPADARRFYDGAALALLLVALALRLFGIDRESFWLDEGYTLFFSQLPLKELLLIGGAHEHPPLYYLIVHLLLSVHRWFLVTRWISAVAGALSVLALYALGRQMFGRPAGLVAATLLTLSPFHVWWSRDGRAYELAGLFVLLSYLAAFRALGTPRRRTWILYAVCTALALYSEYTTAFVILPQALLLLRAGRRHLRVALLASWALAGALFAPWLGVLSHDALSVATDYWIPTPSWRVLENTILEFLGLITPCPNFPCVGPEATLPVVSGHESVLAVGAVAAVVLVVLYAFLSRQLELSILVSWLVLPFALVLVLSLRRSLYLDRVFLDATFALYLLLGALLCRAPRYRTGALAILIVAVVGVGSLANLRLVYSQSSNPDWRSLARDLRAAYRPGQTVIYNPAVLNTLVGAYLPGGWHATRQQLLWFHGYLDIPGWGRRYVTLKEAVIHDPHILPQLRYGRFDTILRDMQLEHATAGQRQVWLVTQDYAGVTDNRRWLGEHGFHLLLSEIYFGDARLELWDRGTPQTFGPDIVPPGFNREWVRSGVVTAHGAVARQQGPARLIRSLPLHPGMTYSVNVEYRGMPGSRPSIHLRAYDRNGHPVGTMVDRFGNVLDSFPRTEWYDMPVNGLWLSQPFGFVAPPGATRATLTLRNATGTCYWRNIEIYRER